MKVNWKYRLLKTAWLVFFIVSVIIARSQPSPNHSWKLSPHILQRNLSGDSIRGVMDYFSVQVSDLKKFDRIVSQFQGKVEIIKTIPSIRVLIIKTDYDFLLTTLLPYDVVLFADEFKRIIKPESPVPGFDLSVNRVNLSHAIWPDVNGAGINISIREQTPDSSDIDLKDRFRLTSLSAKDISQHATTMATIAGGSGNSFYTGKGVAWGSNLSAADFSSLFPDPDSFYTGYQISIQNHSYGTGIENYYGTEAAAFDQSVIDNPSLLQVFSAGNSGDQADSTGRYSGINGFANLTGNFKQSKNTITVGATDSFYNVEIFSSRGPAYDGRLKPEITAFGNDGSSGAAAIVSGSGALLQQFYKKKYGVLPDASLVKGLVLNSADDIGSKGIDFASGYGSLNINAAMQDLEKGNFFSGNVRNRDSISFKFEVPAGVKNLKVMLCWSDPAAGANSSSALINNLDLTLSTGTNSWLPWVLDANPSFQSLSTLPSRAIDTLNNTEQITVDLPETGLYTIKVTGSKVVDKGQAFSVVYQWDSAAGFQWNFPTYADNIFPGQQNIVRWKSGIAGTGNIAYSNDRGLHWNSIAVGVDLSGSYTKWQVPDTICRSLLKMETGIGTFYSESFPVSRPVKTAVGFVCNDSLLIYWNRQNGVQKYQVYELGDIYMQPFALTADTAIFINRANTTSNYFSVSPVIDNQPAVRSETFNYNTQGAGCYISNFLADMTTDQYGKVELDLGSIYQVRQIIIQKETDHGFQILKIYSAADGFQYITIDSLLSVGANNYRSVVVLNNNDTIYSEIETVYFLKNNEFLLFPNPVKHGAAFNLLLDDPFNAMIDLFDVNGRKMYEKVSANTIERIPTFNLARGIYFLRVTRPGMKMYVKKLVVY